MKLTKRYLAIALSSVMVLALFVAMLTVSASALSVNIAPDATITPPANTNDVDRLTDGVKLTGGYGAACTTFSGTTQTGGFVFSFSEVKTIEKVDVSALGGTGIQDGNGSQTTAVKVLASTDASLDSATFTEVAVINCDGTGWQSFVKTFDTPVSARHLKFVFTNSHGETYAKAQIQEIEIYAAYTGATTTVNIAPDATFTPPSNVQYPERLTDGVKLTGGYDAACKSYSGTTQTGGYIFSFNETKSIKKVEVAALGGTGIQDGNGSQTTAVKVLASTDASLDSANFTEVAVINCDGDGWQSFVKTFDTPVSARHLKFVFTNSHGEAYALAQIQEIEIYAISTASTGDNGVVALGIIAFVALAGVAVCAKRSSK